MSTDAAPTPGSPIIKRGCRTHYLESKGFRKQLRIAALLGALFLFIAARPALGLPNLTPYQPPGWSDKIIVARTTGATNDSTGLTTNDALYVSWAVINNGNAAAGANYTYLYVDGFQAGDLFSASLNTNASSIKRDYSIGKLSAGTHTLTMTADATGAVTESNESDNSYTKSITVGNLPNLTPYQPPGWSDKMIVAKTTGATTDSTGLTEADTLYVSWAVINNGNAAAGANSTYLYVDGFQAGDLYSTSLNTNAFSTKRDYSIGKLSAGPHTLTMTADATGAVTESDENDNSYTKSITVGNLPNLAPYQPPGWSDKVIVARTTGATTDSTGLTTADTLYVSWAVINNGSTNAGANYSYLYVDGVQAGALYIVSLNANTSITQRDFSIGKLSAGTHSLAVTNDATHVVMESNENDNSYTRSITVGALPVIAVTSVGQDFGSIQVGTTADRSFTVQNTGGGTLSGSASVPAPFSVVSGSPYSLTASQSTNVTVRYSPTLVGSNSQSVLFTGGAGASRTVYGSGYAAPAISVTPASQDFGSIQVGTTADRSFTVQNTGGGTLSGSASVPAPFSVVSGSPYSLTAGQSTNVTVRYSPTRAGSDSQSVLFTGGAGASRTVSGLALSVQRPLLTGMGLSSGVFHFVLNGSVGSTYVVQLSSDLVNWSPLSTGTIPNGGSLTITDSSTTNQPRRFYRALAP